MQCCSRDKVTGVSKPPDAISYTHPRESVEHGGPSCAGDIDVGDIGRLTLQISSERQTVAEAIAVVMGRSGSADRCDMQGGHAGAGSGDHSRYSGSWVMYSCVCRNILGYSMWTNVY
jgi:hypothetical protein